MTDVYIHFRENIYYHENRGLIQSLSQMHSAIKALKCKPLARIAMSPARLRINGAAFVYPHAHVEIAHAVFSHSEKWPIAVQCKKCWISATERFLRNLHNFLTFIACSVRDMVFRTKRRSRSEMLNRHTHRQTDRLNYSNPRCACTPRVNNTWCCV